MLTTLDNPFDPFDNWDEWLSYDVSKGYNTINYLARVAITANDLTEEEEAVAIESAIDAIVELNVLGTYKKLVRDVPLEVVSEDENYEFSQI